MTVRQPCPPAPGPLETFAAAFDPLLPTLALRRSFRAYLAGLLLPRDRNKTLTALAGAEPIVQAQAAPVQRLQRFLSEAAWDVAAVTAQRLALLTARPGTQPHAGGVLIVDDTGDRKDGTATAHVARQYLGSVGKIDNGIVAVTTLWADARVYYPLHVAPYTPAERLRRGKQDPAFHTKPVIALTLIAQAERAAIPFRAVVADSFYGDNGEFEDALGAHAVPYVLRHKPAVGRSWAPADAAPSFTEAAEEVPPTAWTTVARRFTDGHTETWWAIELTFGGYRATGPVRAILATTDRATLPALSTWALTTNLPRATAPLAEVVRLYGRRVWVEESYKHVKQDLGWADFMVRTDRAIRRHRELVCCAFSFCWWQRARERNRRAAAAPRRRSGGGGRPGTRDALVGRRAPPGAGLAGPVAVAHRLLAGVGERAPAAGTRGAPHRTRRRAPAQSLPPGLTKYR